MKKYIVVALIILVGGALILIPLLKDDTPNNTIETTTTKAAVFDFEGNPGTFVGSASTIKMKIQSEGVIKAELIFDGQILETWNNPSKGPFSYTFTPNKIGTSTIELHSYTKDGGTFVDNRNFRILSDVEPEKLQVEIVETYPHAITHYTQGLEFYNGMLFEGTGQYGQSKVAEINLKTGDPIRKIELDGTYFGEGITIRDDVLYQLTWRKGKCFTYSLENNAIQLKGEYNYVGQEGWGLCNNGSSLIMSDGTERLTFRDPETFGIQRTIDVYNNRGPMTQLNELEFIDGKIYANIYLTNLVVVIDPETGKIIQEIDCKLLMEKGQGTGDVLNGIAYNKETGKIYMTGKNWFSLFEVKFVKPTA